MMDQTILDIVIKAKDEASKTFKETSKNMSGMNKAAVITAAGATTALLGIAVVSVKMAATFQEAMTQLVTGAGESQKNLNMVSAGILKMAVQTGTSADVLAKGMFTVESAGYHGAQALDVLRASAEGAKVGNADLATVTNAVTSVLNAYSMPASRATAVTSMLVETVASGKMHFQDLASSIDNVLPAAAAVHISFAQVGAAIATMTAQGMSADQASQDLASTIRSLSGGNATAIQWMQKLGINVTQLQNDLGKKGLTGTIQVVENAIKTHLNAAGDVAVNAFNQTASATQDLKTMMANMPSSIKSLSQQLMNGSVSFAQYRLQTQMLSPLQANLAKQFETLYNKTHSFNSVLTSGNPQVVTAAKALQDMMGGATGMNTALMLGNSHLPVFNANVKNVAAAAKNGANSVQGWAIVQKDFNFKMSQAKEALNTTGIAIGSALLPPLTSLLKMILGIIEPIATWAANHQALTAIIVGSGVALGALVTGSLLYQNVISKISKALGVEGDETIALAVKQKIAAAATAVWGAAQTAFNAIMDANPIAIVILAVAALAAGIYILLHHMRQVMPVIHPIAEFFQTSIMPILRVVGNFIIGQFRDAWHSMVTAFKIVKQALQPMVPLWHDFLGILKTVFHALKPFEPILKVIAITFGVILLSPILAVIAALVAIAAVIAGVVIAIARLIGWVTEAVAIFIRFGVEVIGATRNLFDGVFGWVSAVIGFFMRLPGDILHAIGNFGNLLYNAGRDLIQGLVNGIGNFAHMATDAVKNVGSDVVKGFKSLLGIHSPSTVFAEAGKNIGAGLALGIQSQTGIVQAATNKLMGNAGGKINVNGTVAAGTATPAQNASAGAAPAGGGNNSITLNGGIHVTIAGGYSGSLADRQKVAVEIWQALMSYARAHNAAGNMPNIGVRPI